jgi:uncharacterized protein
VDTKEVTSRPLQSAVDFRLARLRRSLKKGPTPVTVTMLKKYASDGLAEAQYLLAQMLSESEQPGDAEAAKSWYEAAARQGHIEACKALWQVGPIDLSLEFFIRAADLGDYQASAVLITAYGQKADAPVPNMLAYLQRHVERGHGYAQLSLAFAYDHGYFGLPRDPEKAFELDRVAARQGDAHAQCWIGIRYAHGLGVQQDDEQAVHWYREAARAGSAQAECNLGYSYEVGRQPLRRSMQEANRWYRRAALRDFDVAQYNLGLSYLHGRELPRSTELANRWFARAAQLGNPSAQVALGYSYETSRGVEVSYSRALELYRAAAEAGNAQGQHNYACMLEHGNGIEANAHEAVRWYSAAAEQGLAVAQGNLASMYLDGRGVDKNPAEAVQLWRSAAEQGLATAQCSLAWMYATGTTVTKNLPEALKYYKRAAEQGSEDGAKGVTRVEHEIDLLIARSALNALEDRLSVQDAAYAAKKALLMPILKPIFKHLPPPKWLAAFEEAYANVQLPADGTVPKETQAEPKAKALHTVLYEFGGHPNEIGFSTNGTLPADHAFFLDFSRPLWVFRRFFGIENRWIGTITALGVPVVGERDMEHASHWLSQLNRSDPNFPVVRALWKARYPRPTRAQIAAAGIGAESS